jgi:hypothetical protein
LSSSIHRHTGIGVPVLLDALSSASSGGPLSG